MPCGTRETISIRLDCLPTTHFVSCFSENSKSIATLSSMPYRHHIWINIFKVMEKILRKASNGACY